MRAFFLISFILLFSGCVFFANKPPVEHVQIDCKIYNRNLKLLTYYPGFTCVFLPDGEWVSLFGSDLKFYSKTNELKFTAPQKVHHAFNFSNDLSRLYFLSSEVKIYKGKKTRFDVINIGSRDGTLIASWKVFDHISELLEMAPLKDYKDKLPTMMNDKNFNHDEQREFGHLNAIYEIPPNALSKSVPYLKEGNLIVTFNGLGSVAIFDKNLEKILHITNLLNDELHGIHDAQIQPSGHMTVFKNYNKRNTMIFTSIEEYDSINGISRWSFEFSKPHFQYNAFGGAVQLLSNGNFLITETSYGGRVLEIDRSGKILWEQFNDSRDPVNLIPGGIFRARILGLDSFLKNNHSGNLKL